MTRFAVVEDELLYQDTIRSYLNRYREEEGARIETAWFSSGEEFLAEFSGQFDIILMDIQMPGIDGMKTAEEVRRSDTDVVIMFLTNMVQYAVRGYEVDALDYLVKPIEYFSFSQKLSRAVARISTREEGRLTVPTDTGMRRIPIAALTYLEAFGHRVEIHTKEETFSVKLSMKELEEQLRDRGFFRIGKSYLVRLGMVDGIEGGSCLVGGRRLPISRQKKKEFLEAMALSMGR